MRKIHKFLVKTVLGLGVVAALVTLLSPYPFTPLHPALQEPFTAAPAPIPSLHILQEAAGRKITKEEKKGNKNETVEDFPLKSRPKENVQKEKEKIGDKQEKEEDFVVLEESYLQEAPPKEWVEVKKTKPKDGGGGGGRRRDRRKERKNVPLKDPTVPFKLRGYSPKDLQKRAMTFPESSPVRVFMKEQARRVAHVASSCRAFQPALADVVAGSRGPPIGLLSIKHIIYDRPNQLTFCPVYKSASTTWTVILLQLARLWTTKMEQLPIQKLVKAFYPKLTGLAAASITTNTTHFMVVRHPLSRLLSCYLDKFQNASKDFYYHMFGEKIVKRYRQALVGLLSKQIAVYQEEVRAAMRKGDPVVLPNNPFATPLGPTFPEFVDHVIRTKYDDEHWRTYTSHCAPCLLTYDFILRFESLQEENKWFLEYLNRTGETTNRWDNHNQQGHTKNLYCDYYNQLTVLQIDGLVVKYKKDLIMYEYDVEDYRKCAKDYNEEMKRRDEMNKLNGTITTTTRTIRRRGNSNSGSGGGL